MGSDMLTFCFRDLERLYRPSMGFAAAKMEVRAFRVAYNPQLKCVLKHQWCCNIPVFFRVSRSLDKIFTVRIWTFQAIAFYICIKTIYISIYACNFHYIFFTVNKEHSTLTPALVIEMVCCSIASWMATWSLRSILSNSSIQQTPYRKQSNLCDLTLAVEVNMIILFFTYLITF